MIQKIRELATLDVTDKTDKPSLITGEVLAGVLETLDVDINDLISSYDPPVTLTSDNQVITVEPSLNVRVYLDYIIQDTSQLTVVRDVDNKIVSVSVNGSTIGDSILIERTVGTTDLVQTPALTDGDITTGTATVPSLVTAKQLADLGGEAYVAVYDTPITLASNDQVIAVSPSANVRVYLDYIIQDSTQLTLVRDSDNQIVSVRINGSLIGDSVLIERIVGAAAAVSTPPALTDGDITTGTATTPSLVTAKQLADLGGGGVTNVFTGSQVGVDIPADGDGKWFLISADTASLASEPILTIYISDRTRTEGGATIGHVGVTVYTDISKFFVRDSNGAVPITRVDQLN